MPASNDFLQGEFTRTLDERYRLSIPQELAEALSAKAAQCVLVKERAGCLSLWPAPVWRGQMQSAMELLHAKMRAGKLEGQLEKVQSLGRLLSTRHTDVQLAGRGRLLIPEGFREFLQVPAWRRLCGDRRRRVRGNLESNRMAGTFGKSASRFSAPVRSTGQLSGICFATTCSARTTSPCPV